jgi:long-subunit fatty acid transport protein
VDWNAEVPRYTVLETPDFIVRTPTGDSTVRLVISEQLKSVVNWGVGLEHRFSPTLTGFASFHTDFSAREEGQAPSASITRWNLNHFTVGANWHVWRSDLALGLSGSSASQKTPTLPPPPDGRPLPQDFQTKELLLTVIFGWKIAF